MVKAKTDTAIIFDFDGTIADSFLTTIRVIYKATHHAPLPYEDTSRLRSMSMYQLSRALNISWWKLFFLTRRVRRLMREEMSGIELIPGIDTAIKTLYRENKLFILSSNSTSNIREFLYRHEIDTYFSDIYGDANPLSKKRRLAELIEQKSLSKLRTWYIGDEAQDIKSAKRVGIKAIAVTWGYNNIHRLQAQSPDELIYSPDELSALFNKQ
jgi:phosphoglycolate phosphatase